VRPHGRSRGPGGYRPGRRSSPGRPGRAGSRSAGGVPARPSATAPCLPDRRLTVNLARSSSEGSAGFRPAVAVGSRRHAGAFSPPASAFIGELALTAVRIRWVLGRPPAPSAQQAWNALPCPRRASPPGARLRVVGPRSRLLDARTGGEEELPASSGRHWAPPALRQTTSEGSRPEAANGAGAESGRRPSPPPQRSAARQDDARPLPSRHPPAHLRRAVEVAQVRSILGELEAAAALERPFRALTHDLDPGLAGRRLGLAAGRIIGQTTLSLLDELASSRARCSRSGSPRDGAGDAHTIAGASLSALHAGRGDQPCPCGCSATTGGRALSVGCDRALPALPLRPADGPDRPPGRRLRPPLEALSGGPAASPSSASG